MELRGSPQLTPKRAQFLFKRFAKARLLHFASFPFSVKVPEWATALEEGLRRAHYRQLECQRCSVCNKHTTHQFDLEEC